jgi:hypothetical protein
MKEEPSVLVCGASHFLFHVSDSKFSYNPHNMVNILYENFGAKNSGKVLRKIKNKKT